MATYTTAALVSSLLKLTEISGGDIARLTFDASSPITDTEVNNWIEESEAVIDARTKNSWVATNTASNEYHPFEGAYYDRSGHYVYVYKLDNFPVVTFSSGTDKFEVFDGADWTDLVANYTEGDGIYEGDYWVDTAKGWVYQFSQFPIVGSKTARFTYRYGNASVSKDIQRAATLMTGIRVLEILPQTVIKQGVENAWDPTPSIIKRWNEEIDDILAEHNKESFLSYWA